MPGNAGKGGGGGRGRSASSPGHLKREAGMQSARDYAPGRLAGDGAVERDPAEDELNLEPRGRNEDRGTLLNRLLGGLRR